MEEKKLTVVDMLEKIIEYIEIVKGEKYSKAKLAEMLGKNPKTFCGSLQRKSISIEDLIPIADKLKIDLNKFKGKLDKFSIEPNEFIIKTPEYYGFEAMSAALNPNLCVLGSNSVQNKAVFKRLITDSLQANGKILILNPTGKGSKEFTALADDKHMESYYITSYSNEGYGEQFSIASPLTYIGFDWGNKTEDSRTILETILRAAEDKGVTKLFISNASEIIIEYFLPLASHEKFSFQIIAEAYATYELVGDNNTSEKLKRLFPNLLFMELDHLFYLRAEKAFNIREAFNAIYDNHPNEKMGILNTPYRTNELIKIRLGE